MSATMTITQALAKAVEQECLCLATQRAARAVAREYEAALRPTGLSSWQFTLLMMLARDEAPTIGELAHDLAMDRTTVTGNLKPLERRGLLAVQVGTEDRRVRRIGLTESGRELLMEALPMWRWAQDACSRRLDADKHAAFRGAMVALSGEPTKAAASARADVQSQESPT